MKEEVRLLRDMIEIYSPHGREEEISLYLEEQMNRLGIQAQRDEVGNVIGHIGEGEELLMLCSHMDTIRGKLRVKIKEGVIHGRGACDAKASLAAMMLALSRLSKEEIKGRVLLAAVVDEEGQSIGMRHLLKSGIKARYAVVGEPSGNNRVVIAYKGSLSLAVRVRGRGGHVAAAPLYENAIEKAIDFFRLLKGGVEVKKQSLFYSTNINILKIHGGRGSRIPDRCEMLVNIRFPPGRVCGEILNEASRCASRLEGVDLRVIDCTEAYESSKSSKIALSLLRAVKKIRGETAKFSRKTGTSDMNLMPSGVEAVSFGPGDPTLEHTDREAIDIGEFLEAIDIYEQIVRELITLST